MSSEGDSGQEQNFSPPHLPPQLHSIDSIHRLDLLKKLLELPDLGGGLNLRSPDLGESRALTQPLLTPQLTTGRLGHVVEDKKSIQLKDLASVSHGLAGLGEEAKGQGLWEKAACERGRQAPGTFFQATPVFSPSHSAGAL